MRKLVLISNQKICFPCGRRSNNSLIHSFKFKRRKCCKKREILVESTDTQYSKTNVTCFSFCLLRIKASICFKYYLLCQLATPGLTLVQPTDITCTQCTECRMCSASWFYYTDLLWCMVNKTLSTNNVIDTVTWRVRYFEQIKKYWESGHKIFFTWQDVSRQQHNI
jgi:hypothetical protein